MAPSATDTPMPDVEITYPPAKIYAPWEAHYEKFVERRADGYQKTKSHAGRAAIVIDNGTVLPTFAPASVTA